MSKAEYLLDTGWACGLIVIKDGYIVSGAPIFKKFIGMPFYKFRDYERIYKYQLTKLKNED